MESDGCMRGIFNMNDTNKALVELSKFSEMSWIVSPDRMGQ